MQKRIKVDMATKKCNICGKPYTDNKFSLSSKVFTFELAQCECEDKILKEKEIKKKMSILTEEANIPKLYRFDDMKDWIKIDEIEPMTVLGKIYLKNFLINYDSGVGIFFAGHVGTGKTRVQCRMLRRVIGKFEDITGYFLSSDQFSRKLGELSKSRRGLSEYIEFLVSRGVLLFDDFGESEIPSWRMEHLTAVINDRYYKKKVTWFNTMKTVTELEDIVGKHIVSRVLEMCRGYVCEIESEVDMRLESNKKKYGVKK
jgi:DNA replication protein DnaC